MTQQILSCIECLKGTTDKKSHYRHICVTEVANIALKSKLPLYKFAHRKYQNCHLASSIHQPLPWVSMLFCFFFIFHFLQRTSSSIFFSSPYFRTFPLKNSCLLLCTHLYDTFRSQMRLGNLYFRIYFDGVGLV